MSNISAPRSIKTEGTSKIYHFPNGELIHVDDDDEPVILNNYHSRFSKYPSSSTNKNNHIHHPDKDEEVAGHHHAFKPSVNMESKKMPPVSMELKSEAPRVAPPPPRSNNHGGNKMSAAAINNNGTWDEREQLHSKLHDRQSNNYVEVTPERNYNQGYHGPPAMSRQKPFEEGSAEKS